MILGLLGFSLLGATVPAGAVQSLPAVTTTITLKPATGSVGTKVAASGSGFGATETVGVKFDKTAVAMATTDATGFFAGATFKVPKSATLGTHMVTARGQTSGRSAKKAFVVLLLVKIVGSSGACASSFCFQPPTPTVGSGNTVKWTNRSAATHTVTRCTTGACGVDGGTGSDSGLGSANLTPGRSYQFTFQGAGSYVYYCAIHGYGVMHGTITVS